MDQTKFRTQFTSAFTLDLSEFEFLPLLEKLETGASLDIKEAVCALRYLMSGNADEDPIKRFLIALHEKHETVEEIASFACTMRAVSRMAMPSYDKVFSAELIDTCGTGGRAPSGSTIETFNVSTTAMFLLAAGGVPVSKHGNRCLTSQCGSADVLEELGIAIDVPIDKVVASIKDVGFGFLFAPRYHASTRYVQPVRKQLSHTTVFNILGPLSNPLAPAYQVVGVYDPELTEHMAHVLHLLGVKRAMVVHGFGPDKEGMDELSPVGKTKISELAADGTVTTREISPEDVGIACGSIDALKGGDRRENAALVHTILSGKEHGAKRDLVVLNAAAGFVVSGSCADLAAGVEKAFDLIKTGEAGRKLVEIIEYNKKHLIL